MSSLRYCFGNGVTALLQSDRAEFQHLPMITYSLHHGKLTECISSILLDDTSAYVSFWVQDSRTKIPDIPVSVLPFFVLDTLPDLVSVAKPRIREVMRPEQLSTLCLGLEMHLSGWANSRLQ